MYQGKEKITTKQVKAENWTFRLRTINSYLQKKWNLIFQNYKEYVLYLYVQAIIYKFITNSTYVMFRILKSRIF